jgi:hypothetical protein
MRSGAAKSVSRAQLTQCDVLLTLIGPAWLSAHDSDRQRRLDSPNDQVRQQIKSALQAGVRIIPVILDGAQMPRAASLPPDLKPFARRKALRCAQEHWAGDLSLLTSKIENAVREAELKEQRNCKKQKIAAQASLEAASWANIQQSDPESLKKFLREFPDGVHAGKAARLLERLSIEAVQANRDEWKERRKEISRRILFLSGAVLGLSLLGILGWIWEARWRELTRGQSH